MTEKEKDLLQRLVNRLQWHKANDMPQGKEKVVLIFEDGTMGCNYAVNCALYWKKVERWVYVSEIEEIGE